MTLNEDSIERLEESEFVRLSSRELQMFLSLLKLTSTLVKVEANHRPDTRLRQKAQ